jgi:hypothetical protein
MEKQSEGFVMESLRLRRDLELIGQGIATLLGETANYGRQGDQGRRAQLGRAHTLARSALEIFECVYYALDSEPPALLPSGRFSEPEWPVYVHTAEFRDVIISLAQCARVVAGRADAAYSGNPPELLSNSEFAGRMRASWDSYDALCTIQRVLFARIDETGGKNFPKRCQLADFKEPVLRLCNACNDFLLVASGRRDGFVRSAQRAKDGQFTHLRERVADAGVIGMIWQLGSGFAVQLTSVEKLSRALAEQARLGTAGTSLGFLLAAEDLIGVACEFINSVSGLLDQMLQSEQQTADTAEG